MNPKFDDTQCTGRGTAGRVAAREEYIRSGYADADEKLGIARSLMGGNPTTFAGSDHGFAPAYYAVNANAVLNQATVTSAPTATRRPRLPRRPPSRSAPAAASPRTATTAGGRSDHRERHRQGLLGRRHDPDLRQSGPAPRLVGDGRPIVAELRRGPGRDQGRLRSRHRPGAPGRAGDPEDHGQGGAPGRRRLRLAPPEPQRRCRRRHPAPVSVGCRHRRREGLAVALLRPARLHAEHGRPREQHQHARHVRHERAGRQAPGRCRESPSGRHRPDTVVR